MPTLIFGIIKETLKQTHFVFFAGALGMSSCATTYRGKALESALIASSVGILYGLTRHDYPQENAMIFGSIGGAAGAITSIYLTNPDEEIQKIKSQNESLKEELDQISPERLRKTLQTGTAIQNLQMLPPKYRSLIIPGEWTLYEIDEWEQIDDEHIVNKTKLLELKPSRLNGR